MARASQTTQVAVNGKIAPTLTAPAVSPNGDVVDSGQNVYLWVHNGGGAPINVTLDATFLQDGLALPDLVVAVAAGVDALIGPLVGRTYGQVSGSDLGRVYVDYSSITSVTRAVIAV